METIDRLFATWLKLTFVGLVMAGFVWLAHASLHTHGYDAGERKAMDDLHAALEANDYLTQLEVSLYKNGGKL